MPSKQTQASRKWLCSTVLVIWLVSYLVCLFVCMFVCMFVAQLVTYVCIYLFGYWCNQSTLLLLFIQELIFPSFCRTLKYFLTRHTKMYRPICGMASILVFIYLFRQNEETKAINSLSKNSFYKRKASTCDGSMSPCASCPCLLT